MNMSVSVSVSMRSRSQREAFASSDALPPTLALIPSATRKSSGDAGRRDRRPSSSGGANHAAHIEPGADSPGSSLARLPLPLALVLGMRIRRATEIDRDTCVSTLSLSVTSLLKLLHFALHILLALLFAATVDADFEHRPCCRRFASFPDLTLRHSAPR